MQINKESVREFFKSFKKWESFFGLPRQGSHGISLLERKQQAETRVVKRREAKEEMEEKFRKMVVENDV